MSSRALATSLFFLGAATAAHAALPGAIQTARPANEPSLTARFEAWRTAVSDPNWSLAVDDETGSAQMIYGGRVASILDVRNEEEAALAARSALEATASLHGIDPKLCVLQRALFLPLGQMGSSDKWTVRFSQEKNGVRVVGGFVNVLLDAHGALLSVQSSGAPLAADFKTAPTIAASEALSVARATFVERFGRTPTIQSEVELVIEQVRADDHRMPRLAWRVDLQDESDGATPDGETYAIDASNGALLSSTKSVHEFDVTGTVSTKASDGLYPDEASHPALAQIMKYVRLSSSSGNVNTDVNGNFVFAGVAIPLSVTVGYVGPFCSVNNSPGAEHTVVQTLQPGVANTVLLNPSAVATITSQANAFLAVNKLRDYVRGVNPNDAMADRVFAVNVNVAGTCNAFYSGTNLNFYAAGGGCTNMAFSTIVAHEHGHWMNDLYGTGNGSDGMGEGNADVWSLYVYDTPISGQDVFGVGTSGRVGTNTRPFCGDANPACYGEVHNDGEPWMGAAWKVRARLNTTYGNAMGDLIADSLFLGWMNGYNQTQIKSIIETQWLTLDDNDGNLNSGTPHYADIDAGFRDQSFPGVTLLPISITNVTQIADVDNPTTASTIGADVVTNVSPLASVTLYYSVGSAPFTGLPMSNTTGAHYVATIPLQPYPAMVRYYVSATDTGARTRTFPTSAPSQHLAYDAGVMHVVRFDNFDSGAPGWTTGAYGDASNPENDWARGSPNGKSGSVAGNGWRDPSIAAAGIGSFGNDLGTVAGSDGAYSANVHSYLRSPAINCTGATNVRLRFKSWLTVEGNASDQAQVIVNGTVVYGNPVTTRLDDGWATQEIDISSIADNNPSVQIDFSLRSNATNNYGGWNVDDVRVYWVSQYCPAPANYCVGAPNSTGSGAAMGYSGSSSVATNDFVLYCYSTPPNSSGLFFFGPSQTQVAFGNGFRCVGGTIRRLAIGIADSFGDANRVLDVNHVPGAPITAGQVWNFQYWYRNPAGGGAGYNLSDGLMVTFCP